MVYTLVLIIFFVVTPFFFTLDKGALSYSSSSREFPTCVRENNSGSSWNGQNKTGERSSRNKDGVPAAGMVEDMGGDLVTGRQGKCRYVCVG